MPRRPAAGDGRQRQKYHRLHQSDHISVAYPIICGIFFIMNNANAGFLYHFRKTSHIYELIA
jgi:hypothetical protein